MKRILGTLAVLAVVAAPSLAAAGIDAPHDQAYGAMTFACDNCHGLSVMSASGKPDYSQGCITCHNKPGRAFPWSAGDQANPGVGGKHHSWTGLAESPSHGARTPYNAGFAARLVDGKLQCSVCHDPHVGAAANAPNSQSVSQPLGTLLDPTGGSSTAKMTIVAVGSSPMAFRVKSSTAGGIIVSHDYAMTSPTWFGGAAAWAPVADNGAGRAVTANANIVLDDGVTTVKFTAAPPAGAYWDFVVSYPFVRLAVGADEMCMVCHGDRVQTAALVRGDDPFIKPNGKRLFSHPVGEALGSNGGGYDRSLILDANGASSQTVGDGLAHNNLVLRGNTVMCTTCHAVHSADSNSLTP